MIRAMGYFTKLRLLQYRDSIYYRVGVLIRRVQLAKVQFYGKEMGITTE